MTNALKLLIPAIALVLFVASPTSVQGQIKGLFGFPCANVCPDGWAPNGGLIQASDGNFYGTADEGGNGPQNQVAGTIFQITPSGKFTLLFTFAVDSGKFSNGSQPLAGLVEGNDGFLYGTTLTGGANNAGVIFKIGKAGAPTVLHNFCSLSGCADGSTPFATLVLGNDGLLYGTASAGGTNSAGTIFSITSDGVFTVLRSLNAATDGSQPFGGLLQASDGNFYGATNTGTNDLAANLVRITPAGDFKVLAPLPSLGNVQGQLVQASNGLLYGDIQYDALFTSSLTGNAQPLLLLTPSQDGDSALQSGLIQASDGNLWATSAGQPLGPYGVIYSINTAGTFLKNFAFDCSNGGSAMSAPVQGSDGKLYGTTASCGTDSNGHRAFGSIYSLDAGLMPPKASIVALTPRGGPPGTQVMIRGDHFIGATAVSFKGTAAQFQVLNRKFILAVVPAGAMKGPIAVTNPGGTVKSKQPFTPK
jgi:uncharacterized repeat protein (TIGR03803 family)